MFEANVNVKDAKQVQVKITGYVVNLITCNICSLICTYSLLMLIMICGQRWSYVGPLIDLGVIELHCA